MEINSYDIDDVITCMQCGNIFNRDYAKRRRDDDGFGLAEYQCPSCKKWMSHYK